MKVRKGTKALRQFQHMKSAEKELLHKWHNEGLETEDIAERLGL